MSIWTALNDLTAGMLVTLCPLAFIYAVIVLRRRSRVKMAKELLWATNIAILGTLGLLTVIALLILVFPLPPEPYLVKRAVALRGCALGIGAVVFRLLVAYDRHVMRRSPKASS